MNKPQLKYDLTILSDEILEKLDIILAVIMKNKQARHSIKIICRQKLNITSEDEIHPLSIELLKTGLVSAPWGDYNRDFKFNMTDYYNFDNLKSEKERQLNYKPEKPMEVGGNIYNFIGNTGNISANSPNSTLTNSLTNQEGKPEKKYIFEGLIDKVVIAVIVGIIISFVTWYFGWN